MLIVLLFITLIPMVDSWCWPWEEKIDCILSDWSTWSSCDAPCGTNIEGKQERTRTIIRNANKCGKQCGKLHTERSCTRPCCPVNCVYSWSPVRVHGIHIKGVVKNAKPNVLLPKGALLFQSRKVEAVSLQNSSFSSVFFRFFQFPEKFRKRDLFF